MANELPTRSADKILSEEYLVARAKILELAATLDRLARAPGEVDSLPQKKLLDQAMKILIDHEGDKARRVQLLLSRQYEADWRAKLEVDAGRAR
ncbi:hypothetical protein VN12_17325 [Pirellula sp. SH-Sr6A]|uniref:hypothetical protein n=1 Tax=Pirellula sp. SH-Sr6A TaxID=1632865 RepID=UPI00078E271A|nr:hypothetical protein [Pirellula sp. SH-Sr6A]AMV33894.1 hypothetical protein VN12_17325 [Pirellula sp. SH-Sr6A]